MRIFILIALFLTSIFVNYAICQEQLTHPAKFYQSDNGKLYVNRNEPMYLFLGSKPDSQGELHRLESESSKKYSNPFYFDSEGYNTVRTPWRVDTITRKVVYPLEDVIFEVYADGIPPKTKALLSGATQFKKGDRVYYGAGLKIELNAVDATSGVGGTFYSVNGSAYTPYNDAFELSEENEYHLKYYSIDNVGNVEEVSQLSFIVDTSAPVGNWTLEGDVFGQIASGNSKIIIMGHDELSGIKQIRYQINDKQIKTYTNGINLSDLPSDEYQLDYWIEDNVGNVFRGSDGGVNVVQTFVVDQSIPSTSAEIIGDQYRDKLLYVSLRSLCQLDATDSVSGIRNIVYGFDNKRLMPEIYEEPFPFNEKKGVQIVYFQAFDRVENRSVIEEFPVYMDFDAPQTRINYEGPQFFTRDTLFINSETFISLISEDEDSGVKTIEYKINEGDFQSGDKFRLNNSGLHTIGFRACDNVNNQEMEKISKLYVDNEPPEIYVNFSIQAIREEVVDGELLKVYPPYVRMYIGATDKHCGTQDIFYAVDGGKMVQYTGLQSSADQEIFKEEKVYDLLLEATDKLGNRGSKTIRFKVSNQ